MPFHALSQTTFFLAEILGYPDIWKILKDSRKKNFYNFKEIKIIKHYRF